LTDAVEKVVFSVGVTLWGGFDAAEMSWRFIFKAG
jgi:hypothetical protein